MLNNIVELFEKFDASKHVFAKPSFKNFVTSGARVPLFPFVRAHMEGNDGCEGSSSSNPQDTPSRSWPPFPKFPSTTTVIPHPEEKENKNEIQTDQPLSTYISSWFDKKGQNHNSKFFSAAPGCKDGDVVLSRMAPSSDSQIQVIEWNMMDMRKFYPLSMMSSFVIRCCLYPLTLVKTKIQIQQRASVYKGTWDCFKKTYNKEGGRGLYRGFWVSTFQIVSGVFYVTTYENVRCGLREKGLRDSNIRAIMAGACASLIGQTIIVPFDVLSQHLMIVGMQQPGGQLYNPLRINFEGRSRFEITKDITREIYRRDGMRGFYRGYFASLATYVPNSALWWGFYQMYQDELIKRMPTGTSHLGVQCMSALFGGWTTTILTNPLDVCRARLQVQRLPSFHQTFGLLWREEGYKIFTKGLSARMAQSGVFSTSIILGYETIKRFSVSEEYREMVHW